jgi:hypothetical protein
MRTGILALCAALMLVGVSKPSECGSCNIVNGKKYGDCAGVAVHTRPGPFRVITRHATEYGIIRGASVHSGAALVLHGISTGTVTVQKGGRLSVYGIVEDNVRNLGGRVTVHGIVKGSIISNGGRVRVHGIVEDRLLGHAKYHFQKGAVINGVPRQ